MLELGNQSEDSMTYNDALMYCFSLGDGWRMPTIEEYMNSNALGWYIDDYCRDMTALYTVTPVRDV